MPTKPFIEEYRLKAGFVFTFALLLLFIRFLSNALLSQLGSPPWLFPESDYVYQWLLKSGILHLLTSHFILGGLFDALLFFLPVIFMITLRQGYAILFTVMALLYFLIFNLTTGHHYHGMVGMLVISLPFWTKNEDRFALLWDGARYYLLYIFSSAGWWKVCRGAVFYTDQLSNILQAQQVDLLFQQPDSVHAAVIRYLILHPGISHAILLVTVLLQLSFMIGFFTKKYDTMLLLLSMVFVAANYWVMSIVSAEVLILGITLLRFDQLQRIRIRLMARSEMPLATT